MRGRAATGTLAKLAKSLSDAFAEYHREDDSRDHQPAKKRKFGQSLPLHTSWTSYLDTVKWTMEQT